MEATMLWRDDPSQVDESEGFSYNHGRLRPSRVNIVRYMYILDEDAEDTEDADDDRPSFQSRTTMSVEFYHDYRRSSILLSCLLEDTSWNGSLTEQAN